MNIGQIKKLLEPWIRELIREETDPMKKINKGLEAMDLLKNTGYMDKLANLFTLNKDDLKEVTPDGGI